MTGTGIEAYQEIFRQISNPTYAEDKSSNPIKISKNNFRPQPHITDRLGSISVSVAYAGYKDWAVKGKVHPENLLISDVRSDEIGKNGVR